MLLIIGLLVIVVLALVVFRMRVRRRGNTAELGQMSEQWLAENRASHPQ